MNAEEVTEWLRILNAAQQDDYWAYQDAATAYRKASDRHAKGAALLKAKAAHDKWAASLDRFLKYETAVKRVQSAKRERDNARRFAADTVKNGSLYQMKQASARLGLAAETLKVCEAELALLNQ